jgi:hypothetical protein
MVEFIWEKPVAKVTPIQRWNNKLCSTRRYLGGWARHMTGQVKKEKLSLSSSIDDLEANVEVRPLTTQEINLKNQYNVKLAGLLREEELKWYQWQTLEGDSNTRYFYSVANGRHRKKLIHSLEQEEGRIEGHEQLNSYITSYFKE